MTRKRRTRTLVEGDPTFRHRLAAEVRAVHDVIELEAPNNGLVMIRMRETARKSVFYLGELLVTEAKVQIGGTIGLGIIAGDAHEAALDLAVIDAAWNARLPETQGWISLLEAEEARLGSEQAREETRLLETRVRFETMDVD